MDSQAVFVAQGDYSSNAESVRVCLNTRSFLDTHVLMYYGNKV